MMRFCRVDLLWRLIFLALITLLAALPVRHLRTDVIFSMRHAWPPIFFQQTMQPTHACTLTGGRWRERLEIDAIAVPSVMSAMELESGLLRHAAQPRMSLLMIMHAWEPARTTASIRHWARPRCIDIFVAGDRFAQVEVSTLYFSASVAMENYNWAAVGVDKRNVIILPPSTPGTNRTASALKSGLSRYPDLSWIFKTDDDTFVHVGRLVRMLLSRNASNLILLGRADHEMNFVPTIFRFASGGAGYALSRSALTQVAPRLDRFVVMHENEEDLMVAECLLTINPNGILDVPGLNWHLPENLLARASFRDIDALAAPITYHYISPERMAAINAPPRITSRVTQVWPFEGGPLPDGLSSSMLTSLRENVRSCEVAANKAGLEYNVVNLPDAEHLAASAYYSGRLHPRARELLAALNIAYLDGGLIVSVWQSCAQLSLHDLLPARTTSTTATTIARPLFLDPLGSHDFGVTAGHYFACAVHDNATCTVLVATRLNHAVFQSLASLTRVIKHFNPILFDNTFFGEGKIRLYWERFFGVQPWANISSLVLSFFSPEQI